MIAERNFEVREPSCQLVEHYIHYMLAVAMKRSHPAELDWHAVGCIADHNNFDTNFAVDQRCNKTNIRSVRK